MYVHVHVYANSSGSSGTVGTGGVDHAAHLTRVQGVLLDWCSLLECMGNSVCVWGGQTGGVLSGSVH